MNKIIEITHALQTNRIERKLNALGKMQAVFAIEEALTDELDEAIETLGVALPKDEDGRGPNKAEKQEALIAHIRALNN